MQPCTGESSFAQVPILDLLQYQVQKGKRAIAPFLFSKYGFRRIPTELVNDDARQLWGWHVGQTANSIKKETAFLSTLCKEG